MHRRYVISRKRDKYGGFTEITFKPSGFFRLEKTDRWWFVTPEGNAFLSFGLNHIEPEILMGDYNIEYWAFKFGVTDKTSVDAFIPGFTEKVKMDFALLGMNTLGIHSPTKYYKKSWVPYVKQMRFVDNSHYMNPNNDAFHDVFSLDFVKHCDLLAQKTVIPIKDDPYLLGYSMTDCPIFTDLDAAPRINNIYGEIRVDGWTTWPCKLRNLDEKSPGKRAWVDTMQEIYSNSIEGFNKTYGSHFSSFDALLQAEYWRPAVDLDNKKEKEDNQTFLYKVVDQCYKVEVEAIRKYDKNHLIFGDKLNGNTDTPDEIVKLSAKHMDLVLYQYYALWEDQWELFERWSKLTDKPFLMGDSGFAVPDRHLPDPYGPHCMTQEDKAERFIETFYNIYRQKNFVGWNWCGWMDQWKRMQPGKQHSGLQTPFGDFYLPIKMAMAEFSAKMYEVATGMPPAVDYIMI
jgi:hypothetical protein